MQTLENAPPLPVATPLIFPAAVPSPPEGSPVIPGLTPSIESTNPIPEIGNSETRSQQTLCGEPTREDQHKCVDSLAAQYGLSQEQLHELMVLTVVMINTPGANERVAATVLGGYERIAATPGTFNDATAARNTNAFTNLINWSNDSDLSEETRSRATALLVKLYGTRPQAVQDFISAHDSVRNNEGTLRDSLRTYLASQTGDGAEARANRRNTEALATAAGISLR